MSRQRREQRLLRLPTRQGSDSDPRPTKATKRGSNVGPPPQADSVLPLLPGRGPESSPCEKQSPGQGSSAQPLADRAALIEETSALFSPRYGRTLNQEEARQILVRLTAFFELLLEWEQRERLAKDNQRAA